MLDLTRAYDLDFLFPQNDQIIGRCLREAGEFARPELDVLDALVKRHPGSFIDVGANIGSMCLPVAKRNPAIRVLAVEANRHLANTLAGNVALNRLHNVEVFHAAASDKPGLMACPTPSLDARINFGSLSLSPDRQTEMPVENVRACTVDEIAPSDTTLVKLDVEGFEREVMAGAMRLLESRSACWIFEFGARSADIIRLFLDRDYHAYWLFAPFVTPGAAKSIDRKTSLAGDTNVLAIPMGKNGPPVAMTRINHASEQRPDSLNGYPYLKAYGF